jgi:hypothetical protein
VSQNRYFITPKGVAFYPRLNEPDTRFREDGEYSVKLLVKKDEAQNLCLRIDNWMRRSVEKAEKKGASSPITLANPPYQDFVVPDTEIKPGLIQFSFKTGATRGKRNGRKQQVAVPIFDSQGKSVSRDIPVCGGSILKVSFSPYLFYLPSIGAGVSLRLGAVQIIELVKEVPFDGKGYGDVDVFSFAGNARGDSDPYGWDSDLCSIGNGTGGTREYF